MTIKTLHDAPTDDELHAYVDGRLDPARRAVVAAWLEAGQLRRVDDDCAADLLQRDPQLWAVVVAPWVLAQERTVAPALH